MFQRGLVFWKASPGLRKDCSEKPQSKRPSNIISLVCIRRKLGNFRQLCTKSLNSNFIRRKYMLITYMLHKRERTKPLGTVTAGYLLNPRPMCAVILSSKSSCRRPSFPSYWCTVTSWHQQGGLNAFSLLAFLFLLAVSHFLSLWQFSNAETKFPSLLFAFPLSTDQPCCFITDTVVLTTV